MSQMKEANWIKLTEKKNAEMSNCTDCKIFPCKLEILRLQIATGAEKWSFFFTKAAKLFRQEQWHHVIKCGDMWIHEIVWNCSPTTSLWIVLRLVTVCDMKLEVKSGKKCSEARSQNGKYQVLYAFWCFLRVLPVYYVCLRAEKNVR